VKRRRGGSRPLRLFALLVFAGLALLIVKWRIDPAWVRARSPKLAQSLERLAFIPGFPGAEASIGPADVLALLQDAGVAEEPAALDAGAPPSVVDAGSKPPAGKAAEDDAKKKQQQKKKPAPHGR
jgi:hypothetical protein